VAASTLPEATKRRRKRTFVLVVYFALLCADVVLTNWTDLLGKERCDTVSLTTRMWYQRLVTLGYRKPRPHLTRLVIVTDPPGHPFSACERRAYLARLVNRFGDLGPGMIVLDYYFLPRDDCAKNETADLQTAIDSLAKKTPVIFGLYSWTERELRESHRPDLLNLLSRLKANGFSEHDQVVAPSDIIVRELLVTSGLDRLDCDTRRIPVLWRGRLYAEDGSIMSSTAVPTISLAAARAYDDTVDEQLTTAFKRKQNPFTSFVAEEKFRPVMAADILAGPVPRNTWNLASKIVVVGDYSDEIHESVIGRVPGYVTF
jgi:CHASE2 domain